MAAVALGHLPPETSSRAASYTDESTPAEQVSIDLRHGADGEYDGDLVSVVEWYDGEQLDQVAGRRVCAKVRANSFKREILVAMSTTRFPVAWLEAKADKYVEDAEVFTDARSSDLQVGGLTGEQWATVYRAVAHELRECAREAEQQQPRGWWRRG